MGNIKIEAIISKLKAEVDFLKNESRFLEEGVDKSYTQGYRDGALLAIRWLELSLRQNSNG